MKFSIKSKVFKQVAIFLTVCFIAVGIVLFNVRTSAAVLSGTQMLKIAEIIVDISQSAQDWVKITRGLSFSSVNPEVIHLSVDKQVLRRIAGIETLPDNVESVIHQYINSNEFQNSFNRFKWKITGLGTMQGIVKKIDRNDIGRGDKCSFLANASHEYAGTYIDGGLPCNSIISVRNSVTGESQQFEIKQRHWNQKAFEQEGIVVYLSEKAMERIGVIDNNNVEVSIIDIGDIVFKDVDGEKHATKIQRP